jgi:hypothetical protein
LLRAASLLLPRFPLQSELRDFTRNPPDGCLLETFDPITTWIIRMEGPEAAFGMPRLYEGAGRERWQRERLRFAAAAQLHGRCKRALTQGIAWQSSGSNARS